MQKNGYINLFNVFKNNNFDLDSVYSFSKIQNHFCSEEQFYINGFIDLCSAVPSSENSQSLSLNDFKIYYKEYDRLINVSIDKYLNYLKLDSFCSSKSTTNIANSFIGQILQLKEIYKFISVFSEYFGYELSDLIFNHLYIDYNKSNLLLFKLLLNNKIIKNKFKLNSNSNNNNNNQNIENHLDIYKICDNIFSVIEKDDIDLFKIFFDDSEWLNGGVNNDGIISTKLIQPDIFWYFICSKDAGSISRYLLTDYKIEKEKNGQINPLEIDPLYLLEICSTVLSFKMAQVILEIYPPETIIPERDHLEGISISGKARVLDSNLLFQPFNPTRFSQFISVLNNHKITINPIIFNKFSKYSNNSIYKSLFYQNVNNLNNNNNNNNNNGNNSSYKKLNYDINRFQNSIDSELSKVKDIKVHFRSINNKQVDFNIEYSDGCVNSVITFNFDFLCDCGSNNSEIKKSKSKSKSSSSSSSSSSSLSCIHLYVILKFYDIPLDCPFFNSKDKSFIDIFFFYRLVVNGNKKYNSRFKEYYPSSQVNNHQIFSHSVYGSPFFSSFYQNHYSQENESMKPFKENHQLFLNISRLAYYIEENEEFQSIPIYHSIQDIIMHCNLDKAIIGALLENLTLYGELSKDFINDKDLGTLIVYDKDELIETLFKYWGNNIHIMYKDKIPLSFFSKDRFLGKGLKLYPSFFKETIKNIQDLKDTIQDDLFQMFFKKNNIPSDRYQDILTRVEIINQRKEFKNNNNNNEISIIPFLYSLGSIYSHHSDKCLMIFNSILNKNYPPSKEIKSKPIIQISKEDEEKRKNAELDLLMEDKQNKKKLNKKSNNKNSNNNSNNNNGFNSNSKEFMVKEDIFKEEIKKEIKDVLSKDSTEIETKMETALASSITVNNELEYDIQIGKFKFNRNEINLLGRGSNGTLVFKGLWRDKLPIAIKQMNKMFNTNTSKEMEALIKLTDKDGNNVIRYIDQEEDKDHIYLGLTLCGKSLQDLITTGELSEFLGNNIKDRILDIINGIHFLHLNNIVHNDLNPRNILTKDGRFIISDLGLSKLEVSTSFNYSMHAPTGHDGFHPAEVLLEKRKTKSVDIFSLGCIIYFMASNGHHPFGEKLYRVVNVVSDKFNLDHLKFSQPVLCDLVQQMISKEESSRPTIDQVLKHPYFWNSIKKIQFIDKLNNLFKDQSKFNSNLNKLLNSIDVEGGIRTSSNAIPYLSKPWNQIIDQILIEHTYNNNNNNNSNNKQQQNNNKKSIIYNYDQVKDLIRCIRNTIQHHKEIQKIIQSYNNSNNKNNNNHNHNNNKDIIDSLSTHESVIIYFENKFPDLLFFIYNKFKNITDFKKFNFLNDL